MKPIFLVLSLAFACPALFAADEPFQNITDPGASFPSGFVASEDCETRLEPLISGSIVDFKRLSPREKIRQVHAIADRFQRGILKFVESRGTKTSNEALPDLPSREIQAQLALRLKFLSAVSRKKLEPYAQELLLIANKLGAFTSFGLNVELALHLELTGFIRIVADLEAPDEPMNHALRAMDYQHLAVLGATRLKIPVGRTRTLREVTDAIAKSIREDRLGFGMIGMLPGLGMVLVHFIDTGPLLTPEENRRYEELAVTWVNGLEHLMDAALDRGNQMGDLSYFDQNLKQIESLLAFSTIALFPNLKTRIETLLDKFRSKPGAIH